MKPKLKMNLTRYTLMMIIIMINQGLVACQNESAQLIEVQTISQVVDFSPGLNAGFGQNQMPQIILGLPKAGGSNQGSLDVLSLGIGGEIILAFDQVIQDQEGDDFWVFENVFFKDDQADESFIELAEISVSMDGLSFITFPCSENDDWFCAGKMPSLNCDVTRDIKSGKCGGDAFDLSEMGVEAFQYMKIRDLGMGVGIKAIKPTAGFDLDAVVGISQSI